MVEMSTASLTTAWIQTVSETKPLLASARAAFHVFIQNEIHDYWTGCTDGHCVRCATVWGR